MNEESENIVIKPSNNPKIPQAKVKTEEQKKAYVPALDDSGVPILDESDIKALCVTGYDRTLIDTIVQSSRDILLNPDVYDEDEEILRSARETLELFQEIARVELKDFKPGSGQNIKILSELSKSLVTQFYNDNKISIKSLKNDGLYVSLIKIVHDELKNDKSFKPFDLDHLKEFPKKFYRIFYSLKGDDPYRRLTLDFINIKNISLFPFLVFIRGFFNTIPAEMRNEKNGSLCDKINSHLTDITKNDIHSRRSLTDKFKNINLQRKSVVDKFFIANNDGTFIPRYDEIKRLHKYISTRLQSFNLNVSGIRINEYKRFKKKSKQLTNGLNENLDKEIIRHFSLTNHYNQFAFFIKDKIAPTFNIYKSNLEQLAHHDLKQILDQTEMHQYDRVFVERITNIICFFMDISINHRIIEKIHEYCCVADENKGSEKNLQSDIKSFFLADIQLSYLLYTQKPKKGPLSNIQFLIKELSQANKSAFNSLRFIDMEYILDVNVDNARTKLYKYISDMYTHLYDAFLNSTIDEIISSK